MINVICCIWFGALTLLCLALAFVLVVFGIQMIREEKEDRNEND